MMLRHYPRQNFLLAMLSIVVLSTAPAFAQPQSWAQAGMLTCNLNPTIGFVIFGHQSMECKFQPVSGPVQAYDGAINTVGLDLGVSGGGRLLGPSSARHQEYPTVHSRGSMSGPLAISVWGLASAPTHSWAAQIAALLCNPSPLKDQ